MTNQPPSDAAMRAAAREIADWIFRLEHPLSSETDLRVTETTMLTTLAKHLPVSEQGRDTMCPHLRQNYSYSNTNKLRTCLDCGALLFTFEQDATTPPPASDERCVRCGGKIYQADTSNGPKWGHVDADTECSDPAPSVPAGALCGVCIAAGRVYCPPEHRPAPSS